MKLKEMSHEITIRAGVSRLVQVLVLLMLCSNLLLGGLLIVKRDVTRTILMPPVLHKSVWVEEERASAEYLEEMAYFLGMLYFNITPASVEYNHSLFLKYVSPHIYGKLQIQSAAIASRIRDQQESYQFNVTAITPDPDRNRVAVSGEFKSWVGATSMGAEMKSYLMQFNYENARVVLTSS